jgi:hypothetical protein
MDSYGEEFENDDGDEAERGSLETSGSSAQREEEGARPMFRLGPGGIVTLAPGSNIRSHSESFANVRTVTDVHMDALSQQAAGRMIAGRLARLWRARRRQRPLPVPAPPLPAATAPERRVRVQAARVQGPVGVEEVLGDDVEAFAFSIACGWTRGAEGVGSARGGRGGREKELLPVWQEALLDTTEWKLAEADAAASEPAADARTFHLSSEGSKRPISFAPAFPPVAPEGLRWLGTPTAWTPGFAKLYGAAGAAAAERCVRASTDPDVWNAGDDEEETVPQRAEAAAIGIATAAAISELLSDPGVIRVVQDAVARKLADQYRLGPELQRQLQQPPSTATFRPSATTSTARRGHPVPVASPDAWRLATHE